VGGIVGKNPRAVCGGDCWKKRGRKTHSEETRTQMSESQQLVDRSGANNPMYGITPINAFQSGANHPMFSKVAANAMTIYVYSIDNVLVQTFSSQVACAKWLGVNQSSVSKYIKSGKVWNNQYTFRNSSLLK